MIIDPKPTHHQWSKKKITKLSHDGLNFLEHTQNSSDEAASLWNSHEEAENHRKRFELRKFGDILESWMPFSN